MGVDFAKAALAAGTPSSPQRVTRASVAVGAHDDLLVVKLDVTNVDDAKTPRAPRSTDSAASTSS